MNVAGVSFGVHATVAVGVIIVLDAHKFIVIVVLDAHRIIVIVVLDVHATVVVHRHRG